MMRTHWKFIGLLVATGILWASVTNTRSQDTEPTEPPTLKQTAGLFVQQTNLALSQVNQIAALQDQLSQTRDAIGQAEAVLKASVNAERPVRAFTIGETGDQVLVIVFGAEKLSVVVLE